jgi:diguanylate cyclase (GGDEF)-like protein
MYAGPTTLSAGGGGDEFLALVTAQDDAEIEVVVGRMRAMVAESFLNIDAGRVTVDVSIGVAMAKADDTVEGLFERADTALYADKDR